jgi:deoxycytidine triphosphate deaminase
MMIDFSRFPTDDDDAAARAALYSKIDPFRSVPSALLSSAEIHDYARVTGMLSPFYLDALKSASYEAHIGGSVIWWDEHGHRKEKEVSRGNTCILQPNSITFVQVEPVFRLPNYIAVRFNLRITHVHRGLLLGTGPLVDPGFEGKLLIPLHNLTSSEYNIDTTEALD